MSRTQRAGQDHQDVRELLLQSLEHERGGVMLYRAAIGAALAVRLGLQRVFPTDDHTGDNLRIDDMDRLPLDFGLSEKRTHDDKRHGTTNLFAALNNGTGEVFADCHPRRTAVEFLAFVKRAAGWPRTRTSESCSSRPRRIPISDSPTCGSHQRSPADTKRFS